MPATTALLADTLPASTLPASTLLPASIMRSLWTALVLVLLPAAALAQTAGREAASAGTTPSQPPTPQPDPATALLGTVLQGGSQFMQQGVATMGAGFGQMVGTGDAAEAARTAANGFTRLPTTGISAGHERCTIAPNGAPDCLVAARTLCRAKGFTAGTSVDFITVENCPPQYRTTRRDDIPAGTCTMEHYVTQALCQ